MFTIEGKQTDNLEFVFNYMTKNGITNWQELRTPKVEEVIEEVAEEATEPTE